MSYLRGYRFLDSGLSCDYWESLILLTRAGLLFSVSAFRRLLGVVDFADAGVVDFADADGAPVFCFGFRPITGSR